MERHEQREKAMQVVYQYLLLQRDINDLIEDTYGRSIDKVDDYFIDVIHNALDNYDRYKSYLDEVLDSWSFDRLGFIEKAILLNGCAEFDLKQNSAAVIIDESVLMAKKYCDEETYKLINRVLDVI